MTQPFRRRSWAGPYLQHRLAQIDMDGHVGNHLVSYVLGPLVGGAY